MSYRTPPHSAGSSTDPYLSDATPRSRFRDSISFTRSESDEENARSVMRSEKGSTVSRPVSEFESGMPDMNGRERLEDRIWNMESELETLRRQKDVSRSRKVDSDQAVLDLERGGIGGRPRVETQSHQIDGNGELKSQLSSLHSQMSQMQTLLSSVSERVSIQRSHEDLLRPASPHEKRFETTRDSSGVGYRAKAASSALLRDEVSILAPIRKRVGYESAHGEELDRVIQRAVAAEIERRESEERRLRERELEAYERRTEGEGRKKSNVEKELDRAFEAINRLDDENQALKAKLAAFEEGKGSPVTGDRSSIVENRTAMNDGDRDRSESNQSGEKLGIEDLITSFRELAQALKNNAHGMTEEAPERKERKGPHVRDLGRERPAHPVVLSIERGVTDFEAGIKHLESYVSYVEQETENVNWENQEAGGGGEGSNWLPHIIQLGKDRPAHVAILNLTKSLEVVKEKLRNLDAEVQLTERRRDDAKRVHRAMMLKASQSGPEHWNRPISRPANPGRELYAPPSQWVPMTPSPYWNQYGTPQYRPLYGGPYSQQSFAPGPMRSNSLNMPGPPYGAGDVLTYQATPNPQTMHEAVIPNQPIQRLPFIPPRTMTPFPMTTDLPFQPVIPSNPAVAMQPSPAQGIPVPPDGSRRREPQQNAWTSEVLGFTSTFGFQPNENGAQRRASNIYRNISTPNTTTETTHPVERAPATTAAQEGNMPPSQTAPTFSAALHFSPEQFSKRIENHKEGANDSSDSMRFNVPQSAPPSFAQAHVPSTTPMNLGQQLPTGHNMSANTIRDSNSSNVTSKDSPAVEPLQIEPERFQNVIDGKIEEMFSSTRRE